MTRPWRRLAVSGSTGWPTEAPWQAVVTDELNDYLLRMPPDSMLYLRHGNAEEGVDAIAHRWATSPRSALAAHMQGLPGLAIANRADVEVVEEKVLADWETCNPACRPVKTNGEPHRRPNPGYPDRPRRGTLADYCPSAGHFRNPHVVGFTYDGPGNRHDRKYYRAIPDVRVSLLMAWNYNNSPGTAATVRHAAATGVPHRTWNAYG